MMTRRQRIRAALLTWYDSHARTLPWRVAPDDPRVPDPYAVWLSEVMLQQTTVAAVAPRFERFVARWPTVEALAAAPAEVLMAEWAGLGYYARARNLHACAKAVAERGGFPRTLEGLQALPGIGAYTARAIGAIAFGLEVTPVDGNIERVTARLEAITDPLPGARPVIADAVRTLFDDGPRPGDTAQALMDLGSGVCVPRAPRCGACPLLGDCQGAGKGLAAALPARAPKAVRPSRHGLAWVATHKDRVFLELRPPTGLLGGTLAPPTSPWVEGGPCDAAPPFAGSWRPVGTVVHVFTHFRLTLDVMTAAVVPQALAGRAGQWVERSGLDGCGVATVFRKALALVPEA
jgi:A/G-specific adenine glycosylase